MIPLPILSWTNYTLPLVLVPPSSVLFTNPSSASLPSTPNSFFKLTVSYFCLPFLLSLLLFPFFLPFSRLVGTFLLPSLFFPFKQPRLCLVAFLLLFPPRLCQFFQIRKMINILLNIFEQKLIFFKKQRIKYRTSRRGTQTTKLPQIESGSISGWSTSFSFFQISNALRARYPRLLSNLPATDGRKIHLCG